MKSTLRRLRVSAGIALIALIGCKSEDARKPDGIGSTAATTGMFSSLRARPGSPLLAGAATRFERVGGGIEPRFAPSSARSSARLILPARASSPIRIEDSASGAAVDVTLEGARDVAAETVAGYVIYPKAHASGATLLHRALPEGTEDFVSFDTRPAAAEIAYDVALGKGVAGLRLVAGTLEMLDAGGAPRLRVAPPYIVGADGARTDAVLAVKGCGVDTNPAAPWGRPVKPPGAARCTVRVAWNDGGVAYPAVLDPRWTSTTNTMIAARTDHTATLMPLVPPAQNQIVLVAGGRASTTSTTGLATAELFDPATNTWSTTNAMTGARWSHSATQLGTTSSATTNGKVLIAGGLNGTPSLSTAQLYDPATGTWAAAGVLSAGRHIHTATLLGNGNVLVVGGVRVTVVSGVTTTTILNTAAIFNPSTGAGSWTNVTATMSSARRFHTATLLTSSNATFNNMVLVAGGNSTGTTSLTTAQLFNPANSSWTTTAALAPAREGHTATRLANGNVLITGGRTGTGAPLATTFVFTIPASGATATWVSGGNMTAGRVAHTATLLPAGILPSGGQLLVAGGSTNGTSPIATADIWNGMTTWTTTTALASAVQAHTATSLDSGRVLIAGGNSGTNAVNAAQVFDPFFCTTGSQCAGGFCVGGVCCNSACTGECQACTVPGHLGTCFPKPNATACTADTNPCTRDICDGTNTTCQHPAGNAGATCRMAAGECDQAEFCTGASTTCPADAKMGNGMACPDDGNPCTTDRCDGTNVVCQHAAGNNGTACPDDGNLCTTDRCNGTSTACQHAAGNNGTACPDDGNPCTTDRCDGTNVVCQHAAGNNGTACGDDNNPCTTDRCDGMNTACQHAAGNNGMACPDDANPCTTDTCNGISTTCQHPAGNNGMGCADDGNPCTTDRCNGTSTSCQHAAGNAGTLCRMEVTGGCDQAETCTGTSTACPPDIKKMSGTVCRQVANDCDIAEVCNGVSNACPTDTRKPNGTSCTDGNACTSGEACSAGNCTGGSTVTCPAGQCQIAGTCAPTTGCPPPTNRPNGTTCTDGNACTQTDTCQAGACTGSNPVVCSAPGQCHVAGTCDQSTGVCSNPAAPVNTPCPDGNACNGQEVCSASGTCQAATQVTNGGFESIAAASGSPTVTGAPNNDGDYQFVPGPSAPTDLLPGAPAPTAITGWTTVSNGVEWASAFRLASLGLNQSPAGGAAIDLAAFTFTNGGIEQSVPTTAGQQYRLFFYGGTSKFEGRSGTGVIEVLINGQPFASVPLTGNSATSISWQPFSYQFTAATSATLLTFRNAEDPLQHFALLDGVRVHVCDGSAGCTGGAPPAVDDGNPCTADSCSPAGGVSHNPVANGTVCNDGSACTQMDTCQNGMCAGTNPIVCTADQCHNAGACNQNTGTCTDPTPKADGTACNDGTACTRTDVCEAGSCVGANPVACIPPDRCHTASCDPGSGVCSTTTVGGTCDLGAFDYDKAGRLIRDRSAQLRYDGYDQLLEVQPTTSPPPIANLAVEDLEFPGEVQAIPGDQNSNGHVPVGVTFASGTTHTVLFKGNAAPEDLNTTLGISTTLFGAAMNDADVVAGTWTAPDGKSHVFRYDQAGFHDLGNPGGDGSFAYDINNANEIVGAYTTAGISRGYRQTDAAGFREIPTLGGAQSWAWGIDDYGTVAASAQVSDSPAMGFARLGHAALHHDLIGLQDLNGLVFPPTNATLVTANDLRNDWVVGTDLVGDVQHAYRLKVSTGTFEEIVWPGFTTAGAVNAAGDVVGWGYRDAANTQQAAWILSARTGLVALNDLISPTSGWDLRVPSAIDDFGTVTGWGYHNGRVSAFRLRIPAHSSGTGGPMVAEVHSYGYDGLRTSTTIAPGTPNASTQFWITEDYTQRNGVREHYIRVGSRLVARLTAQPAGSSAAGVVGAPPVRTADVKGRERLRTVLALALMLAAAAGAALGFAKRRRRWVPAFAGFAALLFGAASCEMLGFDRGAGALNWNIAANLTTFFHHGFAVGPILITDSNGALVEERRFEPYGQPIGPANFAAEPQNSLGKLTNPNTGWSYHGARWMQPQTARWTAPDPAVKGPNAKQLLAPWDFNPYAYVSGSPTLFWDPNGEGKFFDAYCEGAGYYATGQEDAYDAARDQAMAQKDWTRFWGLSVGHDIPPALEDMAQGRGAGMGMRGGGRGFGPKPPNNPLGKNVLNVKPPTQSKPPTQPAPPTTAPKQPPPVKGLEIEHDQSSTKATMADKDPKAWGRIEKHGNEVHVTDISRGDQPEGTGSSILSNLFHNAKVQPGQKVVIKNIQNQQTVSTFEANRPPQESRLGKTAANALDKVGLKAGKMEWKQDRQGKLEIQVDVEAK